MNKAMKQKQDKRLENLPRALTHEKIFEQPDNGCKCNLCGRTIRQVFKIHGLSYGKDCVWTVLNAHLNLERDNPKLDRLNQWYIRNCGNPTIQCYFDLWDLIDPAWNDAKYSPPIVHNEGEESF